MLTLSLVACSVPERGERQGAFDVQGHRGARGLLPENTLPAFERALELGVSTLELDVGVTRDGAVVVSHNAYVSPSICQHADGRRIAGEVGPLLRDLTLAQLREYDCGSLNPNAERFPEPPRESRPGATMPLLAEVFELVARSGDAEVRFNIETKLSPGDERTLPADAFVASVLGVVREQGVASRVSIQSFDWRALTLVKRSAPEIETVALLARDTFEPAWLDGLRPAEHAGVIGLLRAAAGAPAVLSPYWQMLLPHQREAAISVRDLQAAGFRIVPWTVNDAETMRIMLSLGVDGLITDYPDRLLEVLRSESIPVL